MTICRYCGRDRAVPCMNTRDMEDKAVEAVDLTCFNILDQLGGGERGIDRVEALRDERMTVRSATMALFRHYRDVLEGVPDDVEDPDRPNGIRNIRWMCDAAALTPPTYPIDKLSRWLGFVQAVMVEHKLTTVKAERDRSRKLFHAAYANEKIDIPPTINMPTTGDDQ